MVTYNCGLSSSASERDDMSETSRQWDSRAVDGRFLLHSYLGGSDHSAVYLTVTQGGARDSEKAAIKLIPVDAAEAEKQLQRWKAVRDLSHPNLIRIFESGLDGTSQLYVVEEYAEENLSQILPERALTAEEARGMLPSILRVLQYLHDHGLVHSHIKPSNILAIGDQVKLASDTLVAAGDRSQGAGNMGAYDPPEAAAGAASTADDVWQLGMTLVEALTQRLPAWDRAQPSAPEVPAAVPEPFREIAAHCLQVDAAKRWTVAEIVARLESDSLGATDVMSASGQAGKSPSVPTVMGQQDLGRQDLGHQDLGHQNLGSQNASAKWPYLLVLAAVVAIAFLFLGKPKPSSHPTEVQSTPAQPGAVPQGSVQSPTQPQPKSIPATPRGSKTGKAKTNLGADKDDQSGIVQRVVPQVSPSARGTIEGKVRVRVKVEVDAAGNVANAGLESAGPSKYFSRLALEAARGWKFSPAQAGEPGKREWTLHFAFSRINTDVSAVRPKR
jgi:TonB family protein